MFVRWKRRLLHRSHNKGTYALDAVLVESYREGSKVKQRFIKHLGSVEERLLNHKEAYVRAVHQNYFWKHAAVRLDTLKLDRSQTEIIERKIVERIPRPNRQEEEQASEFIKDRMRRLEASRK